MDIKEVLESAGYLGVYWTKDDVADRAKHLGKRLTAKKLDDICESIVRRHDASEGINWDVIDCHIQES